MYRLNFWGANVWSVLVKFCNKIIFTIHNKYSSDFAPNFTYLVEGHFLYPKRRAKRQIQNKEAQLLKNYQIVDSVTKSNTQTKTRATLAQRFRMKTKSKANYFLLNNVKAYWLKKKISKPPTLNINLQPQCSKKRLVTHFTRCLYISATPAGKVSRTKSCECWKVR